ncbi:hypothetical protein E0H75_23400 [Kribbella capetownensis]|uniref:Tetratricopeptide repeat protein n=1 Tax=Kribbella capetownensis TaxID=1572659 RepID=A0A4V2M7I2_9ACTN|nr:hypothetical protein [Kribbella capetownensis]TCC47702.1 hypothetical protein E0H75_23400 [Kribbella capetownensis]
MRSDREAEYVEPADPFCGRCTAMTEVTTAPSTFTVSMIGTSLLGWGSRCQECGSDGRVLWFIFGIPLIPLGRYRVISTGGREYYGRKRLAGRRVSALTAALQPVPDVPAEVRDEAYRRADELWLSGEPRDALRLFEEVRASHEASSAADDPAVMHLRLRVAQALLATHHRHAALALFEHVAAAAALRLGPNHPVSQWAADAAGRAADSWTSPKQLARLLAVQADPTAEIPTDQDVRAATHQIRLHASAARAHLRIGKIKQALWYVDNALGASYDLHGPGHPDTAVLRHTLHTVAEAASPQDKNLQDEIHACQQTWRPK